MELEPSWAHRVLPPPILGTQGLTLPSKEGAHRGASPPGLDSWSFQVSLSIS